MNNQTVLVVDDEPAIRGVVSEILEDEGYRVDSAGDGSEAREKFNRLSPDLVLLDIANRLARLAVDPECQHDHANEYERLKHADRGHDAEQEIGRVQISFNHGRHSQDRPPQSLRSILFQAA